MTLFHIDSINFSCQEVMEVCPLMIQKLRAKMSSPILDVPESRGLFVTDFPTQTD